VTSSVVYELDGGIARVRLNRPERMNPIDAEMMAELLEVFRQANDDRAVRVVIVDGVGEHFSVGGDINWEKEFDEDAALSVVRLVGHLSLELRNAPKPYIASVRGYCLGGGHELQLHLDMCVASETAQFGQPEVRWGLLPFWYTPQLLPLVIGERRAREVLLLGDRYDADAALAMGMCNAVVPDDELDATALEWAEKLSTRGITALRLIKTALNSNSDLLRSAANHEAAMVPLVVGTDRYKAEVSQFFNRKNG
jgi:enoyl-CoA hydratase/carnithine racemase